MTIIAKNKLLQIEKFIIKPWDTNTYILTCLETKDSLLVDAPGEPEKILDALKGTNPKYILLTHSHIDHIGAMDELRSKLKVPLAAHKADSGKLSPAPEIPLNDGDKIALGKLSISVIHTPGHSPGSLCFLVGNYLLDGDTLFPGGPGATRTPGALKEIIKSITEKLFVLPDRTKVLPGHGDPTTIKKAKEEYSVFASKPHDPNLCGDVLWLSS